MSGFPGALARNGLVPRRLRASRHRKIDDQKLELLKSQADLHLQLLTYEELARRTGLTLGSIQQLMSQLMREKRYGLERVRRGANKVEPVLNALQCAS